MGIYSVVIYQNAISWYCSKICLDALSISGNPKPAAARDDFDYLGWYFDLGDTELGPAKMFIYASAPLSLFHK